MADAMKLLPCPFCGGTDLEATFHYFNGAIACQSCEATLPLPTKSPETQAAAWNRRASPPALARDDILERIREMDFKAVYEEHHYQKLADDLASPPAREEAPAEGAGEIADGVESLKHQLERIAAEKPEDQPRYANGVRPFGTGDLKHFIAVLSTAAAALRNLTSEPEAGEVEMTSASEVLSLMTRDPVIVAMKKNGLSDSQLIALGYALVADRKSHPAPATADKLRVAVEALEKAYRAWFVEGGESVDVLECVGPLLAALNEQPQ